MTHEALTAMDAQLPAGEARFIRPTESRGLLQQCERDGYISVDMPELRAVLRGRLAWLFEEAVERSLELRGACRSAIGAGATLESCLTDQIYRARLIGARGLTLFVPTLDGITNRAGALDADDSATLRAWICATRRQPIRLYLDVADCMLGAYLDPITLTQLLNTEAPIPRTAQPLVVQWVDRVTVRTDNGSDVATPELNEQESGPTVSSVLPSPECATEHRADLTAVKHQSGEFSIPPPLDSEAVFAPEEPSTQTISQPPDTTLELPALESLPPAPRPPHEPTTGAHDDTHRSTSTDAWVAETTLDADRACHADASLDEPLLDADRACHADASLDEPLLDADRACDADASSAEATLDADRARDADTSKATITDEDHPSEPDEPLAVMPNATAPTGDVDDASLTPIFAPTAVDLHRSSSPLHDIPSLHETPTVSTHSPTVPAPPLAEAELSNALAAPPLAEAELSNALAAPAPRAPLREDAPVSWRTWMERLDAVHGPKPLNFIEQSFVEHYVPLYDAYYRGIAGEECRLVLDQWAASFSQSYSEAFDAMRLRGRRPMMVLDVAETAHRLGRLHGARAVQLVLVDGMRYDLGLRVERLLTHQLAQSAVLTDRFLLWSALPSTTTQQLELLARPESLRDGDVHGETPILVARGRSASTLRRVRVGSRELLKLDLVEARLSEPGGPMAERLDQLALEVADALALALGKLQPRTLVTVFGDHGFCLDVKGEGTSAMRQGGASPNEVLVPAFAWLVGQMH